jgi:hypothetical protein
VAPLVTRTQAVVVAFIVGLMLGAVFGVVVSQNFYEYHMLGDNEDIEQLVIQQHWEPIGGGPRGSCSTAAHDSVSAESGATAQWGYRILATRRLCRQEAAEGRAHDCARDAGSSAVALSRAARRRRIRCRQRVRSASVHSGEAQ